MIAHFRGSVQPKPDRRLPPTQFAALPPGRLVRLLLVYSLWLLGDDRAAPARPYLLRTTREVVEEYRRRLEAEAAA